MIIINNEKYIDLEETSQILKVSPVTVRMRTRAKEMPTPQKLKSLTYWRLSDIESYIEKIRIK